MLSQLTGIANVTMILGTGIYETLRSPTQIRTRHVDARDPEARLVICRFCSPPCADVAGR